MEPVALSKLTIIKKDDHRRTNPDPSLVRDIDTRLRKTQPGFLLLKVGCKIIKACMGTISISEMHAPLQAFAKQEIVKH